MAREDMEALASRIEEAKAKEAQKQKQERKKRRKAFWQDFRKFITKGNILDLAVAVVIGTAFNAIVSGAVSDIINPLISALVGGMDMSQWKLVLVPASTAADGTVISEVAILWGSFLQKIVNFLTVAMCIFLALRLRVKAKENLRLSFFEEQRRAEEQKKAEEAKKAEEQKRLAEAEAAQKAAEQAELYENIRRQTELLERLVEQTAKKTSE